MFEGSHIGAIDLQRIMTWQSLEQRGVYLLVEGVYKGAWFLGISGGLDSVFRVYWSKYSWL